MQFYEFWVFLGFGALLGVFQHKGYKKPNNPPEKLWENKCLYYIFQRNSGWFKYCCHVDYSILIKRYIKSINNNGIGVLSYRSFLIQGIFPKDVEGKKDSKRKILNYFPLSIYLLCVVTRDMLCFGSVVKTCFRHTPVSSSLKSYIFFIGLCTAAMCFQENMCWISGCLMVLICAVSLTFHDSNVFIYPKKLQQN